MADADICDEIEVALLQNGPVTVGSDGEFRHRMGIQGSCHAVKSAMSALIRAGKVLRHRPEPAGCSDMEQPITFKLIPKR